MNIAGSIVVILGALVGAALIMAYPRLRRLWHKPATLDKSEREQLRSLPWYPLLSAAQRSRLAQLSARLLDETRFVGCDGLRLTRDMQLLIAGQASLLCLGAQPAHFNPPGEILVYPDAFYIQHDTPDEHGLVDDLPMLAAGEAWHTGRVVLSWRDIAQALGGAQHNVVLHEFAHLLDFAAPQAEGAPPMRNFDSWAGALGRAFERLREHGSPVIDVYGAESPTEFFAVTVESFFQRGASLAHHHPELYQVMSGYFDIDTARRRPRFRKRTAEVSARSA